MPVINCKFCEGRVEYQEGELTGVCNKCHTTQTLPDLKNEENINLYNKATLFIRNYEFDEAQKLLTQLLSENSCDAEIYWNLALCCYGITYENDITAKSIVPVIHRIRDESFYTNQYYSSNVRFWGETNKNIYKSEAKIIENKLDKVLALADKAGSFDIYISCRIKDEKDRNTNDSIIAQELYRKLTAEGYKVFYSAVTLADKSVHESETYMFSALQSSKIMLVISAKTEHLNSAPVKKEWSEFLSFSQSEPEKTLVHVYKDLNKNMLPDKFADLQSYDISDLDILQDILAFIKNKIPNKINIPSEDKTDKISLNNSDSIKHDTAVADNNNVISADTPQKTGLPAADKKKRCKKVPIAVLSLFIFLFSYIFLVFSSVKLPFSEEIKSEYFICKCKLSGIEVISKEKGYIKIRFGNNTWRVLDIKGTRALIITDKIIGKMPFNEPDGNNYMKDNITWENCSLRKSLNTEFYNSFSEKEKSRILNTKLDNEHVSDPENICNGKNVTDRIFLLSYDDIDKYFAFPTDRIAFMVGEDRKIKDIYHFDGEAWLLRSIKPNYYTWRVTTYLNWGDSTLEKAYGIRPALYLKY